MIINFEYYKTKLRVSPLTKNGKNICLEQKTKLIGPNGPLEYKPNKP